MDDASVSGFFLFCEKFLDLAGNAGFELVSADLGQGPLHERNHAIQNVLAGGQ